MPPKNRNLAPRENNRKYFYSPSKTLDVPENSNPGGIQRHDYGKSLSELASVLGLDQKNNNLITSGRYDAPFEGGSGNAGRAVSKGGKNANDYYGPRWGTGPLADITNDESAADATEPGQAKFIEDLVRASGASGGQAAPPDGDAPPAPAEAGMPQDLYDKLNPDRTLLDLGLGMMASSSPFAGQAFGQAALGALSGRDARKASEAKQAIDQQNANAYTQQIKLMEESGRKVISTYTGNDGIVIAQTNNGDYYPLTNADGTPTTGLTPSQEAASKAANDQVKEVRKGFAAQRAKAVEQGEPLGPELSEEAEAAVAAATFEQAYGMNIKANEGAFALDKETGKFKFQSPVK